VGEDAGSSSAALERRRWSEALHKRPGARRAPPLLKLLQAGSMVGANAMAVTTSNAATVTTAGGKRSRRLSLDPYWGTSASAARRSPCCSPSAPPCPAAPHSTWRRRHKWPGGWTSASCSSLTLTHSLHRCPTARCSSIPPSSPPTPPL
jgi:hypothetical protein